MRRALRRSYDVVDALALERREFRRVDRVCDRYRARPRRRRDGAAITLAGGPLTLLRVGIGPRLEFAAALPSPQSRSITGPAPVGAATGTSDAVVALKYLLIDSAAVQASAGAGYAPPTGSGAFTAGAPAYSIALNVGLTLTPNLALTVSQLAGTATGGDAAGLNRTYFVYAPSLTLAYAVDAATTLLVQDALVSRQAPVLPAGNRALVAIQRAAGQRLAFDLDLEANLAPSLVTRATAVGFGVVWIAAPGRPRR